MPAPAILERRRPAARHCAGGSVSGPKRKPAPGSYSGGWFVWGIGLSPATRHEAEFRPGGTSQSAYTPHPSLPTRPALAPCGEAVGRVCNWPFQAARGRSPGWLLHRNMPVQNRDASTMRCASPPTADRRPPAPDASHRVHLLVSSRAGFPVVSTHCPQCTPERPFLRVYADLRRFAAQRG